MPRKDRHIYFLPSPYISINAAKVHEPYSIYGKLLTEKEKNFAVPTLL